MRQPLTCIAVCVQERFQKYRGLKSFRTSPWNARDSLPKEYTKIFAFQNLPRARKLTKEATQRALEVRILVLPEGL
jgi:pre-rRNA-processing protein TSR1